MIRIEDQNRIRLITLDRPDTRNAFNEALYDAATEALMDAAADNSVAVVVITGAGQAFSSGTDLGEMAARNAGNPVTGKHGFPGMVDQLIDFPKPLLCAVNGLALGIGATMLGLADLVFISTEARVRCPFTRLGVAPEAASSASFPRLLGRQNAMWALLSSEWLSGQECKDLGLAFKVCTPDDLMAETMRHAAILAAKPINSLVECKRTVMEPLKAEYAAARERENEAFRVLLGGPANIEALMAFAERREPDFSNVDDAPITH
ncbi:MAG: enoyl-CoA hydratase/isomerase [Ilumatobacteraceae bacterium]|nr:enoyl-CoA hydratase/isomerase [Ilumatobacteraceae bacterium]